MKFRTGDEAPNIRSFVKRCYFWRPGPALSLIYVNVARVRQLMRSAHCLVGCQCMAAWMAVAMDECVRREEGPLPHDP